MAYICIPGMDGGWRMKYIVILGDGMSGEPLAQLGGKPLWNMPRHR